MSSNWEKSLREQKPRRHPKNPSFSTILLDEMFRSIDGDDEKCDDGKPLYGEQSAARRPTSDNSGDVGRVMKAATSGVEDEEVASLKRAYLMEKLMEKKIKDKVKSRRTSSSLPDMESSRSLQDNDPMFFSTSSSSSSDSSSGGLSLSDAEFYGSAKSRTSCFSSSRPKPNKTNNYPVRSLRCLNTYEQSEYYLFDDYHSHHQISKAEENLIKTKSTALKIYSNLKKVKQPISPGGKLTNFINSLFTSANAKKVKSTERKAKSTATNAAASTCSSASSFSRSCMNMNALDQSRVKYDDSGAARTVRFYPVSVIVDEDSRPCGHKSVYDDVEFHKQMETNRKIRKGGRDFSNGYRQDQKKRDYFIKERFESVQHYVDEDEDEDDENVDAASDSSSDLFEIDHLALFGDRRFCDDLPVYETTHLDRNRAIC